MIARFDHRPVLMVLALATVVCVLMVALTLFVSAQAVPSSRPGVDRNAAPSQSEIVQTMLL
jgi:sensor domain CHASE-containing protein